jgi:hypothetical protein
MEPYGAPVQPVPVSAQVAFGLDAQLEICAVIGNAFAMPACTVFAIGFKARVIGGFTVKLRSFEPVILSAFESAVMTTFFGDVSPDGGV